MSTATEIDLSPHVFLGKEDLDTFLSKNAHFGSFFQDEGQYGSLLLSSQAFPPLPGTKQPQSRESRGQTPASGQCPAFAVNLVGVPFLGLRQKPPLAPRTPLTESDRELLRNSQFPLNSSS